MKNDSPQIRTGRKDMEVHYKGKILAFAHPAGGGPDAYLGVKEPDNLHTDLPEVPITYSKKKFDLGKIDFAVWAGALIGLAYMALSSDKTPSARHEDLAERAEVIRKRRNNLEKTTDESYELTAQENEDAKKAIDDYASRMKSRRKSEYNEMLKELTQKVEKYESEIKTAREKIEEEFNNLNKGWKSLKELVKE